MARRWLHDFVGNWSPAKRSRQASAVRCWSPRSPARFLRSVTVLLVVAVLCGAEALARPVTSDAVLVGAIRWDNWLSDDVYGEMLDDPKLVDRIPYYAVRKPDGHLGFPGDTDYVAQADVHYARAAGLDYFLFGYYLDTGAWRRDASKARALNRAYHNYRALEDKAGVGFAVMFNWSFPREDFDAVKKVVVSAIDDPAHIKAADGSSPVFFFTPSVEGWAKGLGGEDGARAFLADLRAEVERDTGRKLYLTALLFGLAEGGPKAIRLGFDAISTYANGLGGGGEAVPYRGCANGARNFWRAAAKLPVGFLPTMTMGWDYRPIVEKRPHDQPKRRPDPSWCEKATDEEWSDQIRAAVAAALDNPRNHRLQSVIIYAWNEFSEGGWLSPTVGDGTRRIEALAKGLGRADRGTPVKRDYP